MELEFINLILEMFVTFFEIASALIIIYGGLRTVFRILLIEVFKGSESYERIRKEFTDKILFALELLIITDVLVTLREPSIQDLLLVGAIVVIRTFLGYFLSKEAEEYKFD